MAKKHYIKCEQCGVDLTGAEIIWIDIADDEENVGSNKQPFCQSCAADLKNNYQ